MHIAAGVLYALAAVCELAGIALVVDFARKLSRLLPTGALGRIDGGDALGRSSQPQLGDVVELLAKDAARPCVASALLAVGIVAGTVGNFLTL